MIKQIATLGDHGVYDKDGEPVKCAGGKVETLIEENKKYNPDKIFLGECPSCHNKKVYFQEIMYMAGGTDG